MRLQARAAWWWTGLLVAGPLFAQSNTQLLTALRDAAISTTLDDDGLQPWHLKMNVTLARPDGGTESGTVEEWHNGPKQWRIVYDLPSYHGTRARQEKEIFYTAGLGDEPFPLEYLIAAELHPLPRPVDLEQVEPRIVDTGLPSAFRCVSVKINQDKIDEPAQDNQPAFCFDRQSLRFEITVQYRSLVVLRNQTGTFQGRSVPLRLTIIADGKPFASAQVIAPQAHAQPWSEALVTAGLEHTPVLESATGPATLAGVTKGALLYKRQPIYPTEAKSQHVQGPVYLHEVIGTDGHVKDLSVITAPSKDLADAALEAVRDWTYRPYLLNGVPTEVDTTVTIHFTLSTR